jgi:hypothetical protein
MTFNKTGEGDLKTLLQSMKPELQSDVFVFCSLPRGQQLPANVIPVYIFHEREGTTFVVRKAEAERATLSYQFPSRQITLMAYSALDAVGFLAAITTFLAEAGISVNPVSAFYHDHLFVPEERANEAMRLLGALTSSKP